MCRLPILLCRAFRAIDVGSPSPYAMNERLRDVEVIGLGQIEGPEDVILDRTTISIAACGKATSSGFSRPTITSWEVFAHVGGRPLGIAFDRDDNLVVCIGGMGLYMSTARAMCEKLTDETNRSRLSIIDDSRMRLADDLDIAPDGKVYFSEATIRYGFKEWAVDALEGRGNGRIIRYDPATRATRTVVRNLLFPNGICMTHDNNRILFAETWGCRISRYWFEGPKAGDDRDSDRQSPRVSGQHQSRIRWNLLACARGHADADLRSGDDDAGLQAAHGAAGRERRMALSQCQCWLRRAFRRDGTMLETLWDLGGENHPALTSMREHRGYLYLGGITNNRIGQISFRPPTPNGRGNPIGGPSMNLLQRAVDEWFGRGEASITVPPMDGAFRPNDLLDSATTALEIPEPDCLAETSRGLVVSSGRSLFSIDRPDGAPLVSFDAEISALAGLPDGGAALGLIDGRIAFVGGQNDGRRFRAAWTYRALRRLPLPATARCSSPMARPQMDRSPTSAT